MSTDATSIPRSANHDSSRVRQLPDQEQRILGQHTRVAHQLGDEANVLALQVPGLPVYGES